MSTEYKDYSGEIFFTPPHYIDTPDDMPVVFLAGPVQGAPDYQTRFAGHLFTAHEGIVVASPRRLPADQLRFNSDQQVAWEVASRERAYRFGVTAIWFAAQDLADDTYPEGRAYAQTTRIELGETVRQYMHVPESRFVVGFDPEYVGGSEGYIRRLLGSVGVGVANSEAEFLESLDDEVANLRPRTFSRGRF